MNCLPIGLLPRIMKRNGLQGLLNWLLLIFAYGITWNWMFLSYFNAIWRIYEIELRLSLGKIWYTYVIHNAVRSLEKKAQICIEKRGRFLQKQSSIGVSQNSCSAYMHQIFRRTPMQKRDLNKAAAQVLIKPNLRMIILLYIYCIFAKQIFWKTPIGDCFWSNW